MWTGIRKHCATALRCDKKQLAVLSMLLVGGAWSNQALAALDIKVAKEYDGTGTCALDANAQNNLLCTNDEARYMLSLLQVLTDWVSELLGIIQPMSSVKMS